MLSTMIVFLVVLWALCLIGHLGGVWVNLLLVLAVVILAINLLSRRHGSIKRANLLTAISAKSIAGIDCAGDLTDSDGPYAAGHLAIPVLVKMLTITQGEAPKSLE